MVHIIEDKSKNYRGNHDSQMMCMPYVDALFIPQAQMTYASFKKFAKRLAEYFGAAELMILDRDDSKRLITVCDTYDYELGEWTYKFWHEPDDAKSCRDRIYYTKEELIRKDVKCQ